MVGRILKGFSNAWKKLDAVFQTLEESVLMRRILILALALNALAAPGQTTGLLSRFAFGSGLDTNKPQPIWSAVETNQPELFLLLDSVMSTNPADAAESAATTCRIWSVRSAGYDARIIGPSGRQVQIILLDTQTFREPPSFGTLLGDGQWTWFREQLRKPAQVRVVASGIPVVSEDHRGAKWADWPAQRKLLFDMISDTEADGIVFISGGKHHAELSALAEGVPYTLYDLTSNPLNMQSAEPVIEINRHCISDIIRDNNFGLITMDWSAPDPSVSLEIIDERNTPRILHKISVSALQAAAGQGP